VNDVTTIALAAAAALLLFQTLLALNVSLRRVVLRDFRHETTRPDLKAAQLTHRNAAEHVPLLALLLVLLAMAGASREWVLAASVAAIASRLLHAIGYLVPSLALVKITGATLCYVVESLGAAAVVLLALR
jgi:uncharacterized membrane protein YecN with MAPEG domain